MIESSLDEREGKRERQRGRERERKGEGEGRAGAELLAAVVVATPIGELLVASGDDGLRWLDQVANVARRERLLGPHALRDGDPHGAADALRAWFAGELRALDGLPLAARGTLLQQAAWRALRATTPGETITYTMLAARIGTHPRAAGQANARNPVALAIPCHRVVAADGALTGYAGGGLPAKRALLAHERRYQRAS